MGQSVCRRNLAIAGVALPWVLAVLAGALLGVASRYWSEGTIFIVGVGVAVFLGLVGTPVFLLSWSYLRERGR